MDGLSGPGPTATLGIIGLFSLLCDRAVGWMSQADMDSSCVNGQVIQNLYVSYEHSHYRESDEIFHTRRQITLFIEYNNQLHAIFIQSNKSEFL